MGLKLQIIKYFEKIWRIVKTRGNGLDWLLKKNWDYSKINHPLAIKTDTAVSFDNLKDNRNIWLHDGCYLKILF